MEFTEGDSHGEGRPLRGDTPESAVASDVTPVSRCDGIVECSNTMKGAGVDGGRGDGGEGPTVANLSLCATACPLSQADVANNDNLSDVPEGVTCDKKEKHGKREKKEKHHDGKRKERKGESPAPGETDGGWSSSAHLGDEASSKEKKGKRDKHVKRADRDAGEVRSDADGKRKAERASKEDKKAEKTSKPKKSDPIDSRRHWQTVALGIVGYLVVGGLLTGMRCMRKAREKGQ